METKLTYPVQVGQKIQMLHKDDMLAWWVDSGATSHVFKYLKWFEEFEPLEEGSVLRMEIVATEPIKGVGKVRLVFTCGKHLLLDN
ncbi:hypothetical protein HanPI659440_Chr04g0173301 [Helianthus annuus]|nr:hypothetical protein HanPI659440_Chr04g0173301 [Helianthus annuus]